MASNTSTSSPSFRETMRGILPSIVINGVLPFMIYQLLKNYTSASDITALFISSVPSIISAIVGIVRQRSVDLLAGVALAGIGISVVAALISGDPRLFLIRESFLTVVLGIACLVSLLFPKPLWFYIIRYFVTGKYPEQVEAFNARWQYPGFRSFLRVLTLIWGVTFVGEFLLRITLVYNMPIPQFLAIGPIIFNVITIGVIAFTFAYGRWAQRRGEELRHQRLAAAGTPVEQAQQQADPNSALSS